MKNNLYLLLIFLGFLTVTSCGNEHDAHVTPVEGLISINGNPFQPLIISNVSVTDGGLTSTISLSHLSAQNIGINSVLTINLVVPNQRVGSNIDLSTTKSNMTEVMTDSSGKTLYATFTSNSVSGTVSLQFLTPISASGMFNATFKDASGNSRIISNGIFILNQ